MEVSALRHPGAVGLHGRSRLLRLQSDERLIALVRRGNSAAFEVLVSRYQSRLLAFCRHLLGSREDAEDVLQEVMAAAFNAMVADERPINVRPWLYRIARNRCLNHLRRVQAVATDTMDLHLSDFGASTADKVHKAEEFRLLVDDIHGLPETQRTALVLREMDALSYEQIAEAMETTVPSVKSLLVRARLSLAEASEARMLSCEQVRIELAEVAEGLLNRASAPVRRHLRTCRRCGTFQSELRRTSKALAALLPIGPMALAKQLILTHIGHSAGAGASAGSGASGTGVAVGSGAAAGSGAAVGSSAAVGSGAFAGGAFAGGSSFVPVGIGAIASKAAAGLAAAAIVTTTAVEVTRTTPPTRRPSSVASGPVQSPAAPAVVPIHPPDLHATAHPARPVRAKKHPAKTATVRVALTTTGKAATVSKQAKKKLDGKTETQTVATVLSGGPSGAGDQGTGASSCAPPPPSSTSGATTSTPTASDTASSTSTSTSTSTSGTSTETTTTPTAPSPSATSQACSPPPVSSAPPSSSMTTPTTTTTTTTPATTTTTSSTPTSTSTTGSTGTASGSGTTTTDSGSGTGTTTGGGGATPPPGDTSGSSSTPPPSGATP